MADEVASNVEKREPSLMGCVFPILAAVVLLGLGTCVVTVGVLQNRKIAAFTEDEPLELQQAQPAGELVETVEAKLALLQGAAAARESVKVDFSVPELNAMIATQPALEGFRGTAEVTRIDEFGIEARMSHPVRKFGKGARYLNAFFYFYPRKSSTNYWQLELRDIRAPGKEIEEGFVEMFRSLQMFRLAKDGGPLEAVLKQMEDVRLGEGRLIVKTREGEAEAIPTP